MRMIGSLSKPLMDQRGPIGKILTMVTRGAGAGVFANVVDQEVLKGKLKGMSAKLPVQLTDALKGSTGTVVVTANATDAVMLLVASGLKVPNGKSIVTLAGLFLAKKLAEARGWIVDDEINNGNSGNSGNHQNNQQNNNAAQHNYQTYGGLN